MKALILTVLTIATSSLAHAAPGLIGEYFKLKEKLGDEFEVPVGQQPWLVRADKQVNFAEASADFYGSKLDNGFMVRWSGSIKIDKAGEYSFYTHSDDGSRLYLDDKRVVDNWGPHSMTKKAGKVKLTAGAHAIKVIYQEGGGGAGCIVGWTPPGGKEQPLPANALSHDDAKLNAIAWDKAAFAKARSPGKSTIRKPAPSAIAAGGALPAKFGNFIGTALRVGQDPDGNNEAYRTQIIRLNPEGTACVAFDADTMRMVAGWTNGGLTLKGLPFTGGHGQFPSADGEKVFTNSATPGWADPKGSFDEPRQPEDGAYPPLGPLPKSHAHYEGLYVHGERVVLKYTIGGDEVLEMAAFEDGVITRTIQGHFTKPAAVSLGTGKVVATASSGELVRTESRLYLQIFAGQQSVKIAYAETMPAGEIADLSALTKGGPERFTETVTTKGELAKDDGKAAYLLDRLTVPYQNPYGIQMRIGGFDFFSDPSKAAVCTWDGDVWIISNIDDSLEKLVWKRFAAGGHETLGLTIVDDVIYTVADDQITRYHDLNGDSEADFYENFNNDWELTSGFHAFCFDLQTDPEGNFYFAFGSPVRGGGRSFERMSRHHGSIIKVTKDGSQLSRYATGLRAPNGIGVSPTGQLTCGDNEGTFVPRCPIHWIDKDEFLGVVDSSKDWATMKTTPTVKQRQNGRKQNLDSNEQPMPLAWLPKNVDNSNGGQVWVTSDKWGPFAGEMLHMSYGQSALYVVLKEKKGDLMQGGVVKIPVRPTSSAMRAKFNQRDGQLYIAGLKGWQSNAAKEGGLDRVRYTGRPVAMPSSLEARDGGLEIGFTQKLDAELAEDPESFAIKAADIAWTHDYGTKEYKIGQRASAGKEQGWSAMEVRSAKLLPGGKSVFIEIAGFQPVHMMEIKLDLETEAGDEIITKINNTIHAP